MNFTNYVEQEKVKARLKNIEEVRKDINKSWVQEKIQKHIESFGGLITEEEIKEGILTNLIIASKFCKDPGKQNISEKLAIEVLQVEKLPSFGKNCIRFTPTGEITTVNQGGNTKSADFMYNEYYATQKYTKGTGGAQDNQKNDVIDFLVKGSINYKVAAIVDGEYWDYWRPILITEFKDNPNVLITSVTEITEALDK